MAEYKGEFDYLIGKTVVQAQMLVKHMRIRILEEGGEQLIGTMELRQNRINVAVVDGKIAYIKDIG